VSIAGVANPTAYWTSVVIGIDRVFFIESRICSISRPLVRSVTLMRMGTSEKLSTERLLDNDGVDAAPIVSNAGVGSTSVYEMVGSNRYEYGEAP
jgi:hypothetical protein